MTTAHRPTFFNALGGEQQGGNLIVAPTTKICARDLPGQTKLKTRQQTPIPLYQENADSVEFQEKTLLEQRKEFTLQLELKEKLHRRKKREELANQNKPLESLTTSSEHKKLTGAAEEENPFPEDEDDPGPIHSIVVPKTNTKDLSDEDSSDDEKEELLRELEKLKREREEEKKKEEETLKKRQEIKERERALTANVLLLMDDPQDKSSILKRRWDDDVIFKNQAKNIEKPRKRFINDTLRSDFHRKFLAKYIH